MKRTRWSLPVVLMVVLLRAVSHAGALTYLDEVTETCQSSIVSESSTFVAARDAALSRCVNAALACKTAASPAEQATCLGSLLVSGRGECAVGELDSGNPTIGQGAATLAFHGGRARLDAALATLVAGLDRDCFGRNSADLSSPSTGLGFPAGAADALMLADELNRVSGGLGCLSLDKLLDAVPRAQEVVDELRALDHKCVKAGPGVAPLAPCSTDSACGKGGVCGQLAFAMNQGTVTCCAAGEARVDGSCQACAPGNYSDGAGEAACMACPAGNFAPAPGLTTCFACQRGQYSQAGSALCSSCEPGTFSNQVASASCASCPAGTMSGAGAEACSRCPRGTFSHAGSSTCSLCESGTFSQVGASTCSPCAPGTFAAAPGSAECVSCLPGRFASGQGQNACEACQPGTYADAAGSQTCVACPVGTYAEAVASQTCAACPAGTYADAAGSRTCTACPAGTYSGAGAQQCMACTGSAIAPPGSIQCSSCPVHSVANASHTQCLCDVGYYGTSTGGVFTCQACPEGADCSQAGTTSATLGTLPGYWRTYDGTFYRCQLLAYCPGGSSDQP
jgi:hypothetical protein